MNNEQIEVVKECARLSADGKIHFGQVVAGLSQAGVERYHADYSRNETTYYGAGGDSCIVAMSVTSSAIAGAFSACGIESAVRQSQRGEINYPQFTRQAHAAGCVGYFVQITGKCVQYFGRNGEMHIERFPSST